MDDDDETIYVPLPFFFFSTPDIALPFVMLEEYCEKNGKKIVFGDVVDADGNRTFTIVDKIKVPTRIGGKWKTRDVPTCSGYCSTIYGG